jgi:hypothetical protein
MLIAVTPHNKIFATCYGDQCRAFVYLFTSEEARNSTVSCEQRELKFNNRLIEIKNEYFSGRKHTTEEIIRDVKADQR